MRSGLCCLSSYGVVSYGCRNVILRAIKEYESRRLSAQDLKGMRELVEFVEREVRR